MPVPDNVLHTNQSYFSISICIYSIYIFNKGGEKEVSDTDNHTQPPRLVISHNSLCVKGCSVLLCNKHVLKVVNLSKRTKQIGR